MSKKKITKQIIIDFLKKENVFNGGYAEQEELLMKEYSFDYRESHKWLCQIF